ncbi:expressed unknown protein [Seminavis robusta]|uniref:Peptidase M10 metallopeptidase domain-containing protein n=1 Tax=Seminavis robusta TaxID=568900 RepID=A0A9N8DJY8_9STRA|nr:expressed unknown protein [Seminavis robusta]|eukprot:Sro122_g059290.1 n/a (660) ;mRNA; r:80957-83189
MRVLLSILSFSMLLCISVASSNGGSQGDLVSWHGKDSPINLPKNLLLVPDESMLSPEDRRALQRCRPRRERTDTEREDENEDEENQDFAGQEFKIDNVVDITVVEGNQAMDRRNMTTNDLLGILDSKRADQASRSRRNRQLKGQRNTNSVEPGNIRGAHRQLNDKKGKKEPKEPKEPKDKKGAGKSPKKGKKGAKKGCKKGKKGDKNGSDCDSHETQLVYLEFPSTEVFYVMQLYYDPYRCRVVYGPRPYEAYQYSREDMDHIQGELEAMFDGYDFAFTQEQPEANSTEYSTITFDCWFDSCISVDFRGRIRILFGQAEKIDLRNTDYSDNAFVQGNFWQFAKSVDYNDFILRQYTNACDLVDCENRENRDEAYRSVILRQASRTAAHELGHLTGLRHHDSFGPYGNGIAPTIPYSSFYPTYDGLNEGDETFLHIMGSGASVGQPFWFEVNRTDFFSERSMLKLLANEAGEVLHEEDVGGLDNSIKFNKLHTDITLPEGVHAGKKLEFEEIFVKGSISAPGETDFYRFKGKAGEVISAEFNGFDIFPYYDEDYNVTIGALNLYKEEEDGTWMLVSQNHQNFEGFDALMIDATLETDGTFIMEVFSPDSVFMGYCIDYRPYGPVLLSLMSLDRTGYSDFRVGNYYLSIYKIAAEEMEDSP